MELFLICFKVMKIVIVFSPFLKSGKCIVHEKKSKKSLVCESKCMRKILFEQFTILNIFNQASITAGLDYCRSKC